jgi:hypothetical protein
VPVDDRLIVDVFTENEVRFEQSAVDLSEGAGLITTHPFRGGQSFPAVRDSIWPVQRQSRRSGLLLDHRVPLPAMGPDRETPRRHAGMRLERQPDDVETGISEYRGPWTAPRSRTDTQSRTSAAPSVDSRNWIHAPRARDRSRSQLIPFGSR